MAGWIKHHTWVIGAVIYAAFMWGIWYGYMTGAKTSFSYFDIIAAAGAFSIVFIQEFAIPRDKEDY